MFNTKLCIANELKEVTVIYNYSCAGLEGK